jgi:hypothetical protein
MDSLSYYEVLGIPATASAEELRRAHRKLAQRFHPDLHPSEQKRWAEEQMKRVNEAYATLVDPLARARYDAKRAAPVFTSTPPTRTRSATDEWWVKYAASYTPPHPTDRKWRDRAELALWILVPVTIALITVLYIQFTHSTRPPTLLAPCLFIWAITSLSFILIALSYGRR